MPPQRCILEKPMSSSSRRFLPARSWRRIVRTLHRRLITIPLGRFSGQTVDRLRRFHVLNGHDIRSYAGRFIRE